jgi:Tfp pilus assembly major pilin PilA
MELLLTLVVVAVVAFLLYKNFAPKTKSTSVTVADVAAKAEVVEVKAEAKPAKKAPAKKAPAKKTVATKKPKSK